MKDGVDLNPKRGWMMPAIAAAVGVAVLSLAVFDYATSPANHRGIQIGTLFIPIGPRPPVAARPSSTPGHGDPNPASRSTQPPGSVNPAYNRFKPVIRGLEAQGGFPPAATLPYLGGVVANATWAQLQPTAAYNQSMTIVHPNPIDNVLKSLKSAAKSHVLVKIRIFAGRNTPGWTLNLGGPAYKMNDFVCTATPMPAGCNGGSLSYWYPRWWVAGYQAAYARFERALGAAYDSNPAISEVNSPVCMVEWTEPMVRPWESWSETQLLNNGFNIPSDIACLKQEMITQARAFPHTVITVNMNPYVDIVWKSGKPAKVSDYSNTLSIVNFCRTQLGAQCILENDELGRATATPGDPNYSYIYPMILNAGLRTSFEVDNPGYTHNRPLSQTLAVAIAWHANAVEMTNPYLSSQPAIFFASFNRALALNPG